MRDYLSSEVRNVSVLGHSGVGKTSVLEAMLYYTKATDRFGKTSDGSSLIDFDAEEIARGLSVYTSIIPIEWENCKINFIDTGCIKNGTKFSWQNSVHFRRRIRRTNKRQGGSR